MLDLSVLPRTALLVAFTALAGGFAFNTLVMRSQAAAPLRAASAARRRAWLWAWLAAAALAVLADALAQPGGEDGPARLGLTLAARAALLIALALSLRGGWSESPPAIGACAALLLTQSASGHPGRVPEPALPVLADWLHFSFAAIWLGGVAYLAAVLAPLALAQRELVKPMGATIAKFSPLAILCVLAIALTGIMQSASFVGSFEALVGTAYGRALLAKLAGFVVLIGFGAVHQFVIGPQLNAWRARAEAQQIAARRFRLSIAIEAGVAALTLAAAAAMTVLDLPQ